MLWLLQTVSRWLTAWPPPEEHFASMIGDLGWPLAVLLICWLLRRPLRRAAHLLSERMRRDNLELFNFLKITTAEFNTMDRRVAVDHQQAAPDVAQDVDHAESLLEYAGRSDSHAQRLLDWIEAAQGTVTDPEAFLLEPAFAEARQQAYIELIEGTTDE
jgi:hypothetical protein